MLSSAERAAAVAALTALMTADRLSHTIAGTFPLKQIAEAHDAQERPGRIGNIVLET
jgi:NADPH:quinone reductase-like Zn-dependent oxidoreductase